MLYSDLLVLFHILVLNKGEPCLELGSGSRNGHLFQLCYLEDPGGIDAGQEVLGFEIGHVAGRIKPTGFGRQRFDAPRLEEALRTGQDKQGVVLCRLHCNILFNFI